MKNAEKEKMRNQDRSSRFFLINEKDLFLILDGLYNSKYYSIISPEIVPSREQIYALTEKSTGIVFFRKNFEGLNEEDIKEGMEVYNKLLEEEDSRLREIDREANFTLAAVIGLPIIFVVCLFGVLSSTKTITEESVYKKSTKIVSLRSKSLTEGRFSFGRAFLNNQDFYFFMAEDEGGFIKRKAPSDLTLILEKDTVPTFTKYFLVIKNTKILGFFNYQLSKDITVDTIHYNYTYKKKYNGILTVPKGSIEENQSYEPL